MLGKHPMKMNGSGAETCFMKSLNSQMLRPTQWVGRNGTLCLFLILSGLFCGSFAQSGKQPKKAEPKSTVTRGYLSNPQAPGLRFAPPPKPPVAYLPPLPISQDPEPIFSPEFAQAGSELPVPPEPEKTETKRVPPTPFALTDVASLLKDAKATKIPADGDSLGIVSPQMLVRFFENGKTKTIEIPIPNPIEGPINFRVPVNERKRTSSARYEVK